MKYVHNFSELQEAILNKEKEIVIKNTITAYHSIILPEGTILRGDKGKTILLSFNSGDGIGVTANNTITDLGIQTSTDRKAIFTTITKSDLGHFKFENLTITGQFSFITRTGVDTAEIEINNMDIVASDSRNTPEQPQKYGVNVYQGALTIYNFSGNPKSNITATVKNVTIGRRNAPVIGSGIFVSGFGDEGGWVTLNKLKTGAIYSNGMLPLGTADMITAAVFIVYGVKAKEIVHDGEVVTYGVNDMVLDTWGEVDSWTSNKPIISYGPSGVGFVNFGKVKKFVVNAPLETYGLGARGYNQYDGTVDDISFQSITTYGDGSIGVQVSKAIGVLRIEDHITTYGSIGNSLVKGVNIKLPAVALSIKPGGEVKKIKIGGNLVTNGNNVTTYEVKSGIVHDIEVSGKIITNGENSKPISIEDGGITPTENLKTN